MAKVNGLESLIGKLRDRAARSKRDDDASVSVGYTAAYAVYVHEDLEAVHPTGQAKFLEQPARTERDVITGLVRDNLGRGRTLAQSLLVAGMFLQQESMKLVPVDTGALRASAFTRLDA